MNFPLNILSLGAGVQSSTLALMAAAGEVGPTMDLPRKHFEPDGSPVRLEDQQAMLEADPDFGICDRCGGDGMIEYNDGDGSDWGEDCPSEINHLITCRACQGTGKHR